MARCTVERLMRITGLRGASKRKGPGRGRRPAGGSGAAGVHRERPDQLWAADITYIRTFSGWVYAAFVREPSSCRIVGWQLSKTMRTES